jgi:hypothetical protein
MSSQNLKFGIFFWRITAAHMITYFAMGLVAVFALDYRTAFAEPPLSYLMRPVDSPWVALGPALQVFRGLVFSLSLWYFRDVFLQPKYGWLKLWGLIVGLSILSTVGAAPGSIEGFIYTVLPAAIQLFGYAEILPQTLLFSLMVYYWHRNPGRIWNILSGVLVVLILLAGILGFFAAKGMLAN